MARQYSKKRLLFFTVTVFPPKSNMLFLLLMVNRNYSGAPHLVPFEPSRIAQVYFEVPNEPIWSTLEQLQLGGYVNLLLPPEQSTT